MIHTSKLQAALLPALFLTACQSQRDSHVAAQRNSQETQTAQSMDSARPAPAASSKASTPDENQSLRTMAERIWNARRDRDCKTVAKSLDPKEYAALTDEERLSVCEGDPFRYERYSIKKIEVENAYGWVHVSYATKLLPFEKEDAQEVDTIEKWRLIDGQWYPVASRIQETCPESPTIRNSAREAELRKRFDETWKLRLAQDWNALYQLTDPKDHERVPQSDYVDAEGLIHYFESEVEWVQVIGDVGEVRVTYTNKLADPNMTRFPTRKINLSEHYVLRNGVWYRDLIRAN